MLSNPTTGGSVDILTSISPIVKNKLNVKEQYKEQYNINKRFNIRNKKPIQFENKNMYYNEVNGIPIVVYKTSMSESNGLYTQGKKRVEKQVKKLGGNTTKRNRRKYKQKTRKNKTYNLPKKHYRNR